MPSAQPCTPSPSAMSLQLVALRLVKSYVRCGNEALRRVGYTSMRKVGYLANIAFWPGVSTSAYWATLARVTW